MARVADFAQFSDTAIDLRIGGDLDRTLTRNLDATPAGGQGALLKWMVRREGTGSVNYEVKVNGNVSAATPSLWEIGSGSRRRSQPTRSTSATILSNSG